MSMDIAAMQWVIGLISLAACAGIIVLVVRYPQEMREAWGDVLRWWNDRDVRAIDSLRQQRILVRSYRRESDYQADAQKLAAWGFRPISVAAHRNNSTCLYLLLLLLFWLVIPLIILVLLVIVSPPGTRLVVTYERAGW